MPYAFTQEDYRKFQEEIIAAGGDQATLTSVLADMQATFTESMALVQTTKEENAAILSENERLKASNMQLFLRVGEQAKQQQIGTQQQSDPDSPKYRDADEYMADYFKNLK